MMCDVSRTSDSEYDPLDELEDTEDPYEDGEYAIQGWPNEHACTRFRNMHARSFIIKNF